MYEKTGTVDTRHIFAGNQRIAEVRGTTTSYFHNDHLGSPRVVTDASGVPGSSMATKPFGEPHAGNAQTSYGFTGKDLDGTGLYYFAARYYDPSVGRFVTEDSWQGKLEEPWTQNRYVYVGNNPLGYVDPTGHWPEWVNALTEFSTGFMEGFTEAMSYRTVSAPQATTGWQQAGQIVGNTAVMLVGLAEGAAGGGMAAGGFATAATPAGPFLVAVSAKVIVTGNALLASGAGHVVSGAQAMFTKASGSGNSPPSSKPSLKNVSGKEAERLVRQHGFENAHEFKEQFTGGPVSRYNIKVNTKTGEIFLEGIRNGIQISTGLFRR